VRDAPALKAGQQTAAELISRFQDEYPAATKSFAHDLEASLAHLKLPLVHRRFVCTTPLIERGFAEQRRRTKVIPRFFDECSCLQLAFAAVPRAAKRWQRVRISELERRQLELLHSQLQPDPTPDQHSAEQMKDAA